MTTDRYPHLFAPIQLGPMTLANRVVVPGHSMLLEDPNGIVGERYVAYLAERARGGAALVTGGSAPVHANSKQAWPHTWLWTDEVCAGLEAAASAVHAAGGKISIILWHGGHNLSHLMGIVPRAPSPIPSPDTGEIPKEMTQADIDELIEAYAQAARRCSDAGFDAVEIQTSSNYLLGSFLTPRLNRRTDDYGGSLANRTRIVVEVLDAVRAAVRPDLAVGVRTSAEHLIPNDPGGYSLEQSVAAMQALDEKRLVDWVSVMTGSHWCFEEMISPMNYPRTQLAAQAAQFKEALQVPVIVAGRIRTPEEAEAVVAKGQADLVAMARTFIAEPHWLAKVRRGEVEQIRPCMSCNQACLGFAILGRPGSCVLNPRAGREYELPPLTPAKQPRRVAVVGAGPAGLEAARVAAERGHQVTLYEQSDRLGGALALAAAAPHRQEMQRPLAWWSAELQRLGVAVHLGERIEDPGAIAADDIVWATGGRAGLSAIWRNRPQLVDGIAGTADCPHGREILAGSRTVTGKVLVIDEEGGWPAVSLVETLAQRPGVVSVTVTTDKLALGLPALSYSVEIGVVTRRLRAAGIEVIPATLVDSLEDGVATTTQGRKLGPFDGVVLSTGPQVTPVPDGVQAIGDCVTPRSIWAAVTEGMELARRL